MRQHCKQFRAAGFEATDLGGGLWAYVRESEGVVMVVANCEDFDELPAVENVGRPVDLSVYPVGGVGGPAALLVTFRDAVTFLHSLI